MNCNKCKKLIDLYVDDCISDRDYEALLHHINSCEECNSYYNLVKEMVNDLNSLEEVELPEGYANKLHFALERAKGEKPKSLVPKRRKMMIAAMSAIGCLLLVVSSATIINQGFMMKSADEAPMMEAAYDMAAEESVQEAEPMLMNEMAKEECAEEMPAERAEEKSTGESGANSTDGDTYSGTSSESTACILVEPKDTVVLHLDVEDLDKVYNELSLKLDNTIESPENWILHTDEPDEYFTIRCLDDIEVISNLTRIIIRDYEENIDSYYSARIEYETIETETADLQNHGYLFIVIK